MTWFIWFVMLGVAQVVTSRLQSENFNEARADRKAAFTLVELLTVIGIITLLIALMMPALQQARRIADRQLCATQMREVGPAIHMYNDTYREMPGPINGAQSYVYRPPRVRGGHINHQVFPFLGLPTQVNDTEVRPFRCPVSRRLWGPHVRGPMVAGITYTAFRGSPYPFGHFNSREPGTDWGPTRPERTKRLPISLVEIDNPSRVPAMMDALAVRDIVLHVDVRNVLFLDGHVRVFEIDDPVATMP